jgi:hypothetical protein
MGGVAPTFEAAACVVHAMQTAQITTVCSRKFFIVLKDPLKQPSDSGSNHVS